MAESGGDGHGDDDAVGYKKPPKNTRFKKGQSGNPTGRPKGSRSLGARVVSVLETRISISQSGRTRQAPVLDAIYIQMAKRAASGDVRAAKFLCEAAEAEYARRAEKQYAAQTHNTARDRVIRRLDDLAKRMETSAKSPSNGDGSGGG